MARSLVVRETWPGWFVACVKSICRVLRGKTRDIATRMSAFAVREVGLGSGCARPDRLKKNATGAWFALCMRCNCGTSINATISQGMRPLSREVTRFFSAAHRPTKASRV
jgi:hypothetical protein